MRLRVNPIILLSLIIAFVLIGAVFASAQGGLPGDAVAAAMSQVGKPYASGTEGPDTFSCAGLMRYALRAAGVDAEAPWGHSEYLSAYPNDATPQVGDVVVYDSGVAMYIGNDTVVMANAADGVVGTYPMNSIGTILGFANPYGGTAAPASDTTGMRNAPPLTDPVGMDTTAPLDTTEMGTAPPLTDPAGMDTAAPLTDPVGMDTATPLDTTGMGTAAPLTDPVGMGTAPLLTDTTGMESAAPLTDQAVMP